MSGGRNTVAEATEGTLAFQSVGTLAFTDVDEAERGFQPPPGYAKLVAVSSRYGVTCYADPRGLYAIRTDKLASITESLKEKLAKDQVCPPDAYSLTPIGGEGVDGDGGGGVVAHLSFSPDETILAACVAGTVSFYETKAVRASAETGGGVSAAVAPFRRQTLGGTGADGEEQSVRDLMWLPDGSDRYLALVVAGEDGCAGNLLVGCAASPDDRPFAIAEEVVAAAVAPPPQTSSSSSAAAPIVAWAQTDVGGGRGGVTLATITDEGYPTNQRPVPVGPIGDGEDDDEAAEVVIDGVAFGPRPGEGGVPSFFIFYSHGVHSCHHHHHHHHHHHQHQHHTTTTTTPHNNPPGFVYSMSHSLATAVLMSGHTLKSPCYLYLLSVERHAASEFEQKR